MGRGPGGRNFLLVRSGISFALLSSVVSVQFRSPDLLFTGGFQFLYLAVLLSYGWLLIRYAVWGGTDLPEPFIYAQALADVAFISILVFATGGYDSIFSFMYVVVILLGSLERYMRGAVAWAVLSSSAFSLLVYLQFRGIVVPPGTEEASIVLSQVVRSGVTHSTGFLLTGVLSGLLGEDIRRGKQRVQDRDEVILKLETFHKNVIDNIPSGILTTDTGGMVSLLNDAACSILGVTREEATGTPLNRIFSGIDGGEGKEDSPAPRPETRFRRSDGSEIYLGFSSSPMKDAEGRTIGRVVIFQDLTPIKQMEERVRIADRLAGVGELAAGLAHEIRNPLASIAGSSQLLRDSPEVPGEAATLLEIIERETKRLNGLISDFLAYTGHSLRNTGPVDLGTLMKDVVEAVRAGEGRGKGVTVEFLGAGELPVEGDAEQLTQVAWNLVRNAVQATPAGGRIRVDVFEQIRHGVRYVAATVSDSGEGIEPRNLDRIFNPFFTTKEGGTGLGLSISQRIVHFHKGFIEVRSTPGGGSTFSVFLPSLREGGRGA
ncbi:MAG: PAS domain S-box protein [Deltaproteobacteria bacterium]|nr:PAS domain S-box protein [Deltaproteobacteria bacterium]